MNTLTTGSPMNETDAALQTVLPAILPALYQSHVNQTAEAGTVPDPASQDKNWLKLAVAAVRAAPSIYRAIRAKDFQADDGSVPATSQAPIPQGPVPQPLAPQPGAAFATAPQTISPDASGMPAMDEKSWHALLGAVIQAAPSLYRAYRAKELQPVDPATSIPQPAATSDLQALGLKAWQAATGDVQTGAPVTAAPEAPAVDDKVLRVLPAVLPGILQAMQTKDFQSNGGSNGNGATIPALDEKSWRMVFRVARAVAPMALGLL